MDTEARYQQALDYLYSFVDHSLTRNFRYQEGKFDLDRMRSLAERLGNPQDRYPVIHIAGTKGKGSVSAMCASALRKAGYRVGLYTSPHLEDYCERIQVDGEAMPHEAMAALVDELRPVLADLPDITTFEITTALSFLYFARREVTAAVVEVGLGGRLDATNIVHPLVSVITSISYDHTAVLGDTLAAIAAEKAGIIKPGRPVVLAPQEDEARHVVERIANERRAPLVEVGREILYAKLSHALNGGQTMLIWPAAEQAHVDEYIESGGTIEWEPVRLNLSLLGYHQVENAATAYTALQVARSEGLRVSEAQIRQGFASVEWPGRFEVLQRYPPVVVDCAHNRDSARKLRLALEDYFPGQPVILVFGASEDKDVEGMFAELMPRVRRVIATKSFHPRAMEPERLVELAHRYGRPAKIIADVADALRDAQQLARGEALVLVTGSIFVVAGARQAWFGR